MTIQTLRKQDTTAPFGAGSLVRSQQGGFAIMHGTLAPEGCVIRTGAFAEDMFDGTARVFGHAEAAQDAIFSGEIKGSDIIVMRAASTEALSAISRALDIMELEGVCVLTDSRIGNGSHGRIIGNCAPSAAAGGPIALVRDGDTIHIDIATRHIDLMTETAAQGAQKFTAHMPKSFAPGERYARMFGA
ncbi:hypothetical protein AEAC466_07645 [Asticcacaulis sp. AC466]|uniref:dihydroxy-acid dehydratase domain-containing protein n=1 Tax=Asticcacaulis sp. AC466 TaxID=1282362 RepID=UPI0003C3B27E|nr:dihydroxy-acid dehydratase [Asticcacaulis sp. AC466]ESQ84922.1 hypothetical protein AEAC466_07645 [Asticcacaulis sp. AC466]